MSRRSEKQEVQRQFAKFVEEEATLREQEREQEYAEELAFQEYLLELHLSERERGIFEEDDDYSPLDDFLDEFDDLLFPYLY